MNEIDDFGDDLIPPPPRDNKKGIPGFSNDEKDDDKKKEKSARTQWALVGTGTHIATGDTKPSLKSGVYSIGESRGEPIFVEKQVNVDDLMEFPDSKSDKILKEIEQFWKRKEIFKEYGFLHRRGVLLYGPAGSGKTTLVQQIIKKIIDRKGIVFLVQYPGVAALGLSVFREIEPERQVVCVYEDIDAIIRNYGDETLLSVLDGEAQINYCLNIATTNYPENLDKRIVARPRRFDRVIKIGMPSAPVRKAYFIKKLKIDEKEVEQWVKETHNFSFAAMAELVVLVKCFGNTFEQSIKDLRSLMTDKHSSDEFEGKMGF